MERRANDVCSVWALARRSALLLRLPHNHRRLLSAVKAFRLEVRLKFFLPLPWQRKKALALRVRVGPPPSPRSCSHFFRRGLQLFSLRSS